MTSITCTTRSLEISCATRPAQPSAAISSPLARVSQRLTFALKTATSMISHVATPATPPASVDHNPSSRPNSSSSGYPSKRRWCTSTDMNSSDTASPPLPIPRPMPFTAPGPNAAAATISSIAATRAPRLKKKRWRDMNRASERQRHLDRRRNPFFEHAEAEYFLAWRGDEAVGRLSAHVDHRLNEFQDNRWGLFGFFESVRDPGVAAALLDTAEGWVRERGCDRILGPMDFTTNHECGVLVEGHELMPQILENWHHPYYRELLEGQGFAKAMDLYKWVIFPSDREQMLP